MTTIFRYYGDVEYRLNLNYKKYFYYYCVLTGGYIAGFGLYFLTKNWFLVFLAGEAAALVYLAATGTVFRGFLTGAGGLHRHFSGEASWYFLI